MTPNYTDITSRAGEPDWYDHHAAPRYGPFDIKMLDIYTSEGALIRIACQECRKISFVAVLAPSPLQVIRSAVYEKIKDLPDAAERNLIFKQMQRLTPGHMGFGDPPANPYAHEDDCLAGSTMGSINLGVVEWWWQEGQMVEAKEFPNGTTMNVITVWGEIRRQTELEQQYAWFPEELQYMGQDFSAHDLPVPDWHDTEDLPDAD